jgi:hypothetical protein
MIPMILWLICTVCLKVSSLDSPLTEYGPDVDDETTVLTLADW